MVYYAFAHQEGEGPCRSVTKKTGGFARFYRLGFWVSFSASP